MSKTTSAGYKKEGRKERKQEGKGGGNAVGRRKREQNIAQNRKKN